MTVGPGFEIVSRKRELAADEAKAFMGGADVGFEVGGFGELLATARMGAGMNLAVHDSLARMTHVDMLLEFPFRRRLEVAEEAVLVFLFQMSLEEQLRREAHAQLRTPRSLLQGTLAAPEFEFAVDLVAMSFECRLGIKRLGAVLFGAGECSDVQVLFADVLRKRFPLPEALAAVVAAEAVGAFMDGLMAFESGACDKAFPTALGLAGIFAFVGVCGFDVLFQVLVFNVILCTVVIWAFKWPRIGM